MNIKVTWVAVAKIIAENMLLGPGGRVKSVRRYF